MITIPDSITLDVTIPDLIDTDRVSSIYSSLLQTTVETLTVELSANRIKNSEYGDIIKSIIPNILNEAIRLSQLDLELLKLKLDKENTEEQLNLELIKLEIEKERLDLDKKLRREQIKTEQNKNRNEKLQGDLIRRQTQSFDDKVLLELLGIQVNGWTMYASSIGIDADSMLGILNGDNTRELYEKLISSYGLEYQES